MDPTPFYIRHGGSKLTERRSTKRSTKRGDQVYYEDFNPKDFTPFNGIEFDIMSRVTLSRGDPPGPVSPTHVTPTQRQHNKHYASLPPNTKHIDRGKPSEAYMEQCVLERLKPTKHARNMEKLEDDPEVTRVFDKKLHNRWGSYPMDVVTEFTYMEVMGYTA